MIIFLRTAWMIHYRGVTTDDLPSGAGHFVDENLDGGEVMNFLPAGRRFYGFARLQSDGSYNLARLGAGRYEEFVDDVTVVFFAKNPFTGGQFVVGWYEHARFFRHFQVLPDNRRPEHPHYNCYTNRKNAVLLPLAQRKFRLPADGPGQTNAWYVMEYRNTGPYLKEFAKFKRNPAAYGRKKSRGAGWQLDAEKRKVIEIAAMSLTESYFVEKGFTVSFVHRQNLGWDMEASLGNMTLKLEVKGTSQALRAIELTPNEYAHSARHKDYRVCIGEHVLDPKKAALHICSLDEGANCWRSETGKRLAIIEVMSARLELI